MIKQQLNYDILFLCIFIFIFHFLHNWLLVRPTRLKFKLVMLFNFQLSYVYQPALLSLDTFFPSTMNEQEAAAADTYCYFSLFFYVVNGIKRKMKW